uniref:Nesprin-2-like n=1 Tax=Cyprinus carpio carpio TaxID=630221 RepID=A0A9J7YPI6_CYPCA
MIVVQDYEEEKSSPQPQMHPSVQVKDSQSFEVKSQNVVHAETKMYIEHHVESQVSLPQPVTQQQTETQWQVQGPVASQPSQNLQQAESQVHNEQQIATQPYVHIQQQEKTQLAKQQNVQPQVPIQSQPQGQLETQTQQVPKQQRKVKKSQAHLQNRPWLQQRSQLENVTQKPAPQLVPQSQLGPEDKCQLNSQTPLQHIVAVSSPEAQGPAQSATQSKSIVESDEKDLKPAQPLVVTQKLPQTVPAVPAQSVTQKQTQQPVTVPIHQQILNQPQPFLSTQAQAQQPQATAPIKQQMQPQIVTPQQPQVMIQKQAQSQSMTPMQPQVMAQWQPQQTIAQPQPAVPQPQIFSVAQTMPQGTSRPAQQYPASHFQPQIMMQGQQSPHGVAQAQSQQPTMHNPTIISPQPKGASTIQPRIISMPQPQMPLQSQTQTQVKAQGSAPLIFQPQGQPQWYQPGDVTQTYPNVQGPISVADQMQHLAHFQTHPQPPSIPPAQPQQWSPIRPGIENQTYPTVQVPGQVVQPQSQMSVYPKIQPQSQPQQWPSAIPESPCGQSQIRPQGPAQHVVTSHHWRPVSPVYPGAETQGPKGPLPQSQYQALPRPPSTQRQWGPVRPEHQFQVSSQTMLHGVFQPEAPWNHPPAQAPIRPQSPQQPQQRQQKWSSSRIEAPSETLIQSQAPQAELQSQDQIPQQQSAPLVKQLALAQAPPQAYTEAYIKAQALVRNRFEEAKHCLQEHIIEAISVFKDKRMTDEQASVKEETLRTLDSELLEEFLRAVEGMEAFCTPSELRDMEFFTQSVRTQWKAVRVQISEFLKQLRFELTRLHFNHVVETCEINFKREKLNLRPVSISESKEEACLSAEGSLAEAGQQLEALKELCDTLSPEDAHRLAQAQLRECERQLAAIQQQFGGDRDTSPPDTGLQREQTKEQLTQKAPTVPPPPEKPKQVIVLEAVTPVSPQPPRTVEKREIVKQMSTEEDRYRSSRFALQAQLNRNEQCMLGDHTSESVTPTDLQKRLRELKSLWDETESLWKEYEALSMQCVQYNERGVEQDRMELTVRWREQRSQLQGRVDSLGAALELMDSIKLKISEIAERLDNFIKEPKDIKGYTLANPAILRDVKDLDESIQSEMDRLSQFDSEPSHLDLRDRSPLTQVVLNHRSSLDRLRQQVRKSDAAARALDRFLMSLRTVELDVSSVQSAPSNDAVILQDSRSKLALIRKGVSSLKDKAPQLDQLLGGAQLKVTQDGRPVSCLDMVGVLVHRVEEADDRVMIRQNELQKEQQNQSLGLRRKTMQAELRKVQVAAEKQGLKDPTMPAVQHRMQALCDLESQLNSLRPEYQSIKKALPEVSPQKEHPDPANEELEFLWEETERAVSDRQEQCTVLTELLKKFQSCRSYLGNTLQRAEQTINEQASYMGKDNLQRLLAKVVAIKDDLNSLGPKMEEFRSVCRQLQSQLKKIPDCSETPFEMEADALVDSWLDVSEKTDSYMDNLRGGLELWEKQLVLGGEVDSWTSTKLIIFSESHPFSSETEVVSMRNEIQCQEDKLEHFHRKLLEIKELLQSKESPLELQVMETNLRKKMEQVKELFSDCTEVFQELLTVKAHLIEKIDTYQSSVNNICSSVDMISSEDRTELDAHLQDLCEQLLDQEGQAESLMKEINLMSSITGSEALEELTNHTKRLKDCIVETRELIRQKKEQWEKSFLQTMKEEFESFEEWLQDEQLAVNECFENPERKQDVETSMQRLTSFLASKEGEQRLAQLKERFERGGQAKLPTEAQALLSTWHQEQEGELATLRAHCQGRHKQLDDILHNLNSLQEEHNHLKDWLQQREQVPEQREKLRQIQEDFLKESGRVEAFNGLLSAVRMRGLRGDPLLRDTETLIDRYHSLGILFENQVQILKTLDGQIETFQTNAEQIRAWIRNLKQELEYLGTDTPTQEKHINTQAVLNLSPEGEAKLVALKEECDALCSYEILEDTRRQELIHTHGNIEDEWKRVLDMAQQLKHQAERQDTLNMELEDLKDQEESIQSWVREQLQMLQSLGKDLQPHEKLNKVQAVIDLGDEADSRLASLQRQGQHLCSYKELENERRSHIHQTQSAVEEEWRKVLQLAQELKNQVKHEESLYRELQTFCDQGEDTQSWIRHLRETLDSLHVASSIQERLNGVEALLAHRSEGDYKLSDLKMKGENLCSCEDLEEDKRQTIQHTLQNVQQEWMGVLMQAQELKNQSDLEDSLSKDLQDLQEVEENTQSWLKQQHLKTELLGQETQLQERMHGAHAILNSESEGDYKLANLRRKAEDLCSREGLEEKRKQEIQLNLRSIEEEWKNVLASAQELKNQAELQDSLARELQNVYTQEASTWTWVKNQKDGLDSLGKSTHGTQEQIEERLSKAQAILSLHSEGNSKITALKWTIDHLFNRQDLDEDARHPLIKKMKNLEEEWKTTLQQAQELHSLLKSVRERLVSCQCQKDQLQSRLEQVKQQTAALPRHFPWPGLGDRRQTLEQAKSLLDRTRALTPSLSAVRALGREMSQLTHDSSWIDPSWATIEECIPELIKDLTELCVNLKEEIRRERVCAQLVEQHTVAQDWLREQVKGFGALPTERHGLQSSVNTLKALLQTIDREKREMKDLVAVKDSLMDLCTPGGCDALTLEVSHLHDLCVASEKEIRERLSVCEARLSDIDLKLAGRAQILREQAESLLNELCAQDHSLGFLVGSQNVSQLQENWHSFKTFERDLESLECRVRDLGQALRIVPPEEEPPSDVLSIVDTVTQQYCSLRLKLSEMQNDCADSTVQCVRQALQNIQAWNQTHANPSCSSATSMQAAIEEGVRLCKGLQVVLSHKELLRGCLGPDLADKLERDRAKALNEADTHMNDLKQELKNLEEKVKQEAQRLSLEAQSIQLDSQVSAVTPSTKDPEHSEFVSSSSFITESFEMTDDSEQAKTQDQDMEVSPQVGLMPEITESPAEEEGEPEGPTMKDIFMEIKKMTEKGSKSVLMEGMPHESTKKLLDTSSTDLEARLKRLVFHLLDLRTCPAALNSTDMAKQLEEAEECRRCAQRQVSMLSRQDQANGDIDSGTNGTVHDPEGMQQLSAQWSAALWDAASSVHSKEAQLQMVADFDRQTQKIKAILERLKIEHAALRFSPAVSSFAEEERLLSFLRNMEQEKTALGELTQTHAKLSPYLSVPQRQAAEIQQNNLQSQWRALAKDAEIGLYKVKAYAKEIGSLIQEVSALKDHLENIQKTLDASKTSPVLWDSKRAQEIMTLNADLTFTHQQCLYLQQTSEALAKEFQFKAETSSIVQDLQHIKDQQAQMGENLAAATPSSSNPTLSKIVKVMTDALAWAKQTECDVIGRQKKVSLLPEEVHRQIKNLKKSQSEMSSKQTQLKALVEEVTELICELDEADVSMVTSSLNILENLSKSTAGKLAEAVREMESGLQTREKMSEQIADIDSWVVVHRQRVALRKEDYQSLSVADLDRRLRQIQDTLGEAEKQSAVTEALLMKSRDIASELSVSENTQLYEKLTSLQEDIKSIVLYEKACCQKVMDVMQCQESSQRKVSSLENSLRQMLVDVKRHRFPVTKDTLSVIEPFKQMIMERKSQVEQVSLCSEDKRRELLGVITELYHKMIDLELKSQAHERYLSFSRCIDDVKEEMETQIPRTKDESISKEERYRACQALLIQINLIKLLCEETMDELEEILADLYPSQISTEQARFKQILESLKTSELAVNNNLQILEWDLLKHIHYPSEKRVLKQFLKDTNVELKRPCSIEPKEAVIEKQLRRCLVLRKNVESRMRVLEFLEKKIGAQPPQDSKQLTCLKDMVLEKCDQRMMSLSKAKELLKNYTKAVIDTIRFLQRAALVLLPSICSARSCSERLKDTQHALLTLDTEFQSLVSQLQAQTPQHPCFKPQQIEFLHTQVLGELLVRLSTLKAQAQIHVESLKRCVECQKHFRKCYKKLCQQVRDLETLLLKCASKKITSHKDCKDQQQKLKALVEEVAILPGKLENLREWCSLYGCRANREDAVSAIWAQVAKLQRCANDLQTRSEHLEAEWSSVTRSVEQAATVLEQMDAELPDSSRENLTGDELQDLLLFWSQYQDRLDCEQRALSALELRAARLLGVPPNLEQAPPIELCQELQALQEHYHSLKERSSQGLRTVRTEVEERERVQEQLEGVREWLESANSHLAVLEHEPSKKQLQEVHSQLCTQKAVLQRISESLKMMCSDKNTSVPEEIEGLLQEVSQSLQEVEEQVKTAVEKSGPLHRLGAKISEVKAGLGSVQSWLEQKSLNFTEAESTQKRVWDELDCLHTCLTAVEVELQDVNELHLDERRLLLDSLANTQQTHTRLTKQAEQRTTFLSKVRDWLQEREEMVKASQSWISEAQSWLTTQCTYTTARCLDSHVNALQMVLDDSAQMRRTLQGFSSVLTEMGSVFDVSPLEEELSNADRRVADMQHSLLGPLSQLEHAAAEVDAIETEVKVMEKDVAKIKSTFTTKEDISQDCLKSTKDRIDLMKRTVAEIQNCKDGLCLPDKAENTLLVFKKAELLQKQLLELEQLALEYSIEVQETSVPPLCATPLNAPALSVPPTIAEEDTQESGQIKIVHVEEDGLKKSGAALMTVEQSTPEQRLTWISERRSHTPTETQQEPEEEEELFDKPGDGEEDASDEDDEDYEDSIKNEDEEARGRSPTSLNSEGSSSVSVEDSVSADVVSSTEQILEKAEATYSKVEADTSLASGTGVSEALSETDASVESQSLPADMVTNTSSVTEISTSPSRSQQWCLVS